MEHNKYKNLLSPIRIGGLVFKNRITAAPTTYFDLGENGHLTAEAIAHFEERAKGGASVVCIGDACVEKETGQHCFNQQYYMRHIFMDDHGARPGLTTYADAIHSHGAYASIELSHGGTMSNHVSLEGRNPIGPSGYTDKNGKVVEEMDEYMIQHIADCFAKAAMTAKECGLDMVMIHAGHGWLLHQFLSPLTNFRTDEYGGSLENRARFPLLVIKKVREAVGKNFPIEVRMTGDELHPGGYTVTDGVQFAQMLDGLADLIHVSAGTNMTPASGVVTHPSIFQKEGHNLWLAAEIKKHVKTPVATVGAFTDPEFMEETIASGKADIISCARALIADPSFPNKLKRGQEDDMVHCLRCLECMGSLRATRTVRCAVNPIIGREIQNASIPAPKTSRKVMVVGGGPGGMEAALTAARRGHTVTLVEKSNRLGGALYFADGVPFKQNIVRYREFMKDKVVKAGVKILLNTIADEKLLKEEKPYVLIAAVGADPIIPPIPGIENAIIGADLTPETQIGEKVVIVGGGLIGCETGIHLTDEGHEVTIIEMLDRVAADCGHFHRVAMMEEMKRVNTVTETRVVKISDEGVYALDMQGNERFFPADTVIAAVGMKPKSEEVERLRSLVTEFYVVGDCAKAGRIINAVRGGYDAVIDMERG